MPAFKIFESEDGLVTTTVHGMGQDAYVVTEDRVSNFNNYSQEFQLWLSLFSIAFGAFFSGLQVGANTFFYVSLILSIVFGIFLFLSYKKFIKVKESLFKKAGSISSFSILEAKYGANTNFIDVTQKLKDLIQNDKINLTASNEIDHDPAPGIHKQLNIKYTFEGKTYEKSYEEGEEVKLPN